MHLAGMVASSQGSSFGAQAQDFFNLIFVGAVKLQIVGQIMV
jgi:hypothetical protein